MGILHLSEFLGWRGYFVVLCFLHRSLDLFLLDRVDLPGEVPRWVLGWAFRLLFCVLGDVEVVLVSSRRFVI